MVGATAVAACIFCRMAHSSTSTPLLHSDDGVVAFQDVNPSASGHYLVIPVEHISTMRDLKRRAEDYTLVSHMLDVGRMLLQRDMPQSKQCRTLQVLSDWCLGASKNINVPTTNDSQTTSQSSSCEKSFFHTQAR